MRAPEPLSATHDLAGFDSGNAALDEWLKRRALKNEGAASRTYVVCEGVRVVGYVSLAAGALVREAAPARLRRNAPDPIPVVLIGRLAVDRSRQGRGIGKGLLRDALLRTVQAADRIGGRAVLVHAIDEDAARFYRAHGFLPSPIDERTLMLPMETIRAALG